MGKLAFTPRHRNTLLCTLASQLDNTNSHPRLLRFYHNLFLSLDSSHYIFVVIYIRALGAGILATPKFTHLTLRLVGLRFREELAVILLRLDAIGSIVSLHTGKELINLRIFAVLCRR